MALEEIKTEIDSLSADERKQLSAYLVKSQLENDREYWNTIRERMGDSVTEADHGE